MSAAIAIDDLIARFFAIFDNTHGRAVDLDALSACFVPDAVIVKKIDDDLQIDSVASFIRPRAELFASGDLVDFHEWETDARTTVVGHLATRHSRYRKQGLLRGAAYAGGGSKSFQLIQARGAWKIVSVIWEDDPPAT